MQIEDKKEMLDVINSCYIDILEERPTLTLLNEIAVELPEEIKYLAAQWDWWDTEVRDAVYHWIRDSVNK